MSNTFGNLLRLTTSGESHGPEISCVLDGVPSGIPLSTADIQGDLNRRAPGQSKYTTPRKEPDLIEIRSGVYDGQTTGSSISLAVQNTNTKSEDYDDIAQTFRPGHADATLYLKYGLRDPRGGGRSSYRTLVVAVAAGAIAKRMNPNTTYTAFVDQIGPIRASIDGIPTQEEVEASPVRCPDLAASERMEQLISEVATDGDSIGGALSFVIEGAGHSLGEPAFGKLSARLAHAMMSINATKGFEIGLGANVAELRGSQYNDAILEVSQKNGVVTRTNNAGGILGGISTGMPITGRVQFHPTASISIPQDTVDVHGDFQVIITEGRHDPCVLPRAVPAVEAMAALVVADLTLQNRISRI